MEEQGSPLVPPTTEFRSHSRSESAHSFALPATSPRQAIMPNHQASLAPPVPHAPLSHTMMESAEAQARYKSSFREPSPPSSPSTLPERVNGHFVASPYPNSPRSIAPSNTSISRVSMYSVPGTGINHRPPLPPPIHAQSIPKSSNFVSARRSTLFLHDLLVTPLNMSQGGDFILPPDLPEETLSALETLEIEYREGELTAKGYERRRRSIFRQMQPSDSSYSTPSPSTSYSSLPQDRLDDRRSPPPPNIRTNLMTLSGSSGRRTSSFPTAPFSPAHPFGPRPMPPDVAHNRRPSNASSLHDGSFVSSSPNSASSSSTSLSSPQRGYSQKLRSPPPPVTTFAASSNMPPPMPTEHLPFSSKPTHFQPHQMPPAATPPSPRYTPSTGVGAAHQKAPE
ncbi:hypothetical protein BJ684DRAFT_21888, partial [Piptocephalis cylindrospora]